MNLVPRPASGAHARGSGRAASDRCQLSACVPRIVLQMFLTKGQPGRRYGGARIDGGVRGSGGEGGRRPGPCRLGHGRLQHRRPRRQGGARISGARSLRPHRLRSRPAGQAHHRQSRSGGHAEGGQPLRPSDRARRDGRDRRHSDGCARGLRRDRRARARRDGQRGRWRASGGDRRQCGRQGTDLPGFLRAGGGLGLGRPRHPRAALADPARQPLQGGAGPVAPAARRPGARRTAAGSPRHQGTGERETRPRGRRRRRSQPPDERRARSGQVDAGAAASFDPAAADPARTARSVDDPLDRRPARRRGADGPAPVPKPASLRIHAGARRRRQSTPGRAKSRWRTTAFCFSTSFPSSRRRFSTRCASRSRRARSRSPEPIIAWSIRRASSLSRR